MAGKYEQVSRSVIYLLQAHTALQAGQHMTTSQAGPHKTMSTSQDGQHKTTSMFSF